MGIARSTYYDQPTIAVSDTELVETMAEIAETFEAYGYRRMRGAAASWPRGEPQEDQTPNASTRSAAEGPAAICRHHP